MHSLFSQQLFPPYSFCLPVNPSLSLPFLHCSLYLPLVPCHCPLIRFGHGAISFGPICGNVPPCLASTLGRFYVHVAAAVTMLAVLRMSTILYIKDGYLLETIHCSTTVYRQQKQQSVFRKTQAALRIFLCICSDIDNFLFDFKIGFELLEVKGYHSCIFGPKQHKTIHFHPHLSI